MICSECGTEFRQIRGSHQPTCSVECRFLSKVNVADPDDCWEWIGSKATHGYSYLTVDRRRELVHRFSYETYVGPIPDGLQIDHLCRNRCCVNPDHLEAVTPKVNTLRGEAPNIVIARSGLCKRGHSMEDAIIKPNGTRSCRPCHAMRAKLYRNGARLTSK